MIRNSNGDKYLASGSDHGCSSLILWDTRTWSIQSKVACHTAAVTAIVDLEDGQHLVTGSYDKKINLFNHTKGKLITSLNNNKTSVTSMIMSSDKSRLISAGLDNSLSIWSILRKNHVTPQLTIAGRLNNPLNKHLQRFANLPTATVHPKSLTDLRINPNR